MAFVACLLESVVVFGPILRQRMLFHNLLVNDLILNLDQ